MGRPHIGTLHVFGPTDDRYETALLDTGSQYTILGPAVARDVGLSCGHTEREDHALAIAGKRVPVCRTVKLEIADSDCLTTMEVYVAHKPIPGRFPTVVGADFMEQAGMILDLRRGDHTLACDIRRRDPQPPADKVIRPRRFRPRRSSQG